MGIGLGLFLLILAWSATLLGAIFCSRPSSAASTLMVAATTLFTAILVAIPRYPPEPVLEAGSTSGLSLRTLPASSPPHHHQQQRQAVSAVNPDEVFDHMFILRIVVVVLMGSCAVAAGIHTLFRHCTEQVYATPIGRSK